MKVYTVYVLLMPCVWVSSIFYSTALRSYINKLYSTHYYAMHDFLDCIYIWYGYPILIPPLLTVTLYSTIIIIIFEYVG